MNSKSKKTISLYYISVLTALFILGCSATQSQEVENNSNGTPQVEQGTTEPILHTPTVTELEEEFIPSLTPRVKPSETPTVIPTEETKPHEYYVSIQQDLKQNFGNLIAAIRSSSQDFGNPLKDPNVFYDDGRYEVETLKKFIEKFLELSCYDPDMLIGIDFEPFVLGDSFGETGKNLDINVKGCSYSKQALEKLEENGPIITLTHPVFEDGVSNKPRDLFPGIESILSGYYADGTPNRTGYNAYKELPWYSGMILGLDDYKQFLIPISDKFGDGSPFNIDVPKFVSKPTKISIPTDSQGNMVFRVIMVLPKGITPDNIERMITRGSVMHVSLFSNKILFRSSELSE